MSFPRSWLPFLLGLRGTGCFGADLRVYVYDTQLILLLLLLLLIMIIIVYRYYYYYYCNDILQVYVYDTAAYSSGSVFCSAGQWGVEVMLHRFFASSTCRTLDAAEADLFLLNMIRQINNNI